ncbi:MAG: prolyl oligopeptidase family serine peptidase [Candidatus Bathyarchaeota archaeon]|nr:MAG: prolyl oligopeptidase family serine peptidase [Candidatus Bathyarchaeota archaeon]
MNKSAGNMKIVGVVIVLCIAIVATKTWMDHSQRVDGNVEATHGQLDSLIHEGKYSEAMEVAELLLNDEPDDPELHRILTYLHSMMGETEKALYSLEEAIDNGFDDYLWMSSSPGLESIQDYPRTVELIQEAYSRLEERMAVLQGEKEIHLREGEWTGIRLGNDVEYPFIDASLSFDTKALMVRATVRDLHFRDGERSWRYGDGFLINFVIPGEGETVDAGRFYELGFSLQNGVPVGVLVNLHGVAYLDNIQPPTIEVDEESHTANYTITLPWTFLQPFRPLLDGRAGINIRYTSAGDEGARKLLTWLQDPHIDSEQVDRRRFAPLYFDTSESSELQFSGELGSRLIDQPVVEIAYTIYSPVEMATTFEITVRATDYTVVAESSTPLTLRQGRNELRETLDLGESPEGFFTARAILNDSLSWSESFYMCYYDLVTSFEEDISILQETGDGPLLRNSIESLKYRIDTLRGSLASYRRRDNPRPIVDTFVELTSLISRCGAEGSIFNVGGYVLAAFESPIDGSLQPYSLMLPSGFDESETYDLVVVLHGSGVDEIDSVREAQSKYNARERIVVGPRGRGLSDFWVGDTEKDTIHLLGVLDDMFHIDRTLLAGFSMGGYGCWRLSLLHPECFDAVIVGSGIPYNARMNLPEYDMRDKIGAGKDTPYLVVHGTDDQSIDIEHTDEFVNLLEESGYDVTYIRVEGGGHADLSVTADVYQWLREKFD